MTSVSSDPDAASTPLQDPGGNHDFQAQPWRDPAQSIFPQ